MLNAFKSYSLFSLSRFFGYFSHYCRFYSVLDFGIFLHIDMNRLTNSFSHCRGGLPSGRFRSLGC